MHGPTTIDNFDSGLRNTKAFAHDNLLVGGKQKTDKRHGKKDNLKRNENSVTQILHAFLLLLILLQLSTTLFSASDIFCGQGI